MNPYVDGYAKAIWEQEHGNKTDWKPQRPKPKSKPLNKPKRAFIPAESIQSVPVQDMSITYLFKTYLHGLPFLLMYRTLKGYFIVSFRHEYKTVIVQGQIPFLSLMLKAT